MSGGPSNEPQKSRRKCNKKGKRTRDATTQCGKWLALKKAVEKDGVLRAEVLQHVETVMAFLGSPNTEPLTPEDELILIESREDLLSHHIADLTLMVQPLNTCKWNV